jgi:prolycopene isomerase
MGEYDAVVIGAGNGGLTAATTLARGGMRVLLLERHNIPGGCATSFCRGRFEFEVALHQLSGLGSEETPGQLRRVLGKLGVADALEWVAMDNLYRVQVPGELDLVLPADRNATIDVLQQRFPGEKKAINEFFNLIYKWNQEMVMVLTAKSEVLQEHYPTFFKYALRNYGDVLDEFFSDPLLKLALGVYWCYAGTPPSRWNFTNAGALMFNYLHHKPFHIIGGSQALSAALLNDFINHGGEVRFNCAVDLVLAENGRVNAIVTEAGEIIKAHYVISNASSIDTYVEMLDSRQVPQKQFEILSGSSVGPSAFIVYMGLDCLPQEVGLTETTNFICVDSDMEKAYRQAKVLDVTSDMVMVTCYNLMDQRYAPEGCSQVTALCIKYAEPWVNVPPAQYFDMKYQCASRLLDRVESQYPGFQSHIEEMEIATPLTLMRYLGTPGGAIYGFDQYAKDSNYYISPRSPIEGLFLVGAWAGDGGFQPTLVSGHAAARTILRKVRRK